MTVYDCRHQPLPLPAVATGSGWTCVLVKAAAKPAMACWRLAARRVLHQGHSRSPRADHPLRIVRNLPEERLANGFLGLLQVDVAFQEIGPDAVDHHSNLVGQVFRPRRMRGSEPTGSTKIAAPRGPTTRRPRSACRSPPTRSARRAQTEATTFNTFDSARQPEAWLTAAVEMLRRGRPSSPGPTNICEPFADALHRHTPACITDSMQCKLSGSVS
jgi:hypothetical protein